MLSIAADQQLTNTLRIGAGGEITTDNWKGWIDEFRISVGIGALDNQFPPPRGPISMLAGVFAACIPPARRPATGKFTPAPLPNC